MLKKAGLIILLIVIFGIMIVFSYLNTGDVEVNLAFVSITTSISIAFTVALRRALRISESEVSSLRNLPLSDAD
jgi:predicted permease